jgi:hypothetical protein
MDQIAAFSLPTVVVEFDLLWSLTRTRSYIHVNARSANPAKGNLHERRI